MDLIVTLTFIAFGALLLNPRNGNGGGGIAEAQPIPLQYNSSLTTSVLDPEAINPYRNQVVGTNSYLTMVQTSSYEFINIQPDEVVPPRFKNTQPQQYFFTVPNNKKIFNWNVPEYWYALRVPPSDTNNLDHVQVIVSGDDMNKVVKILQDKMTVIVAEYNRQFSDSDGIGGGNQENPQDDVDEGVGGGISGGFGTMSQSPPPKTPPSDNKIVIAEDESEIVVTRRTSSMDSAYGPKVNIGGSPYAGL